MTIDDIKELIKIDETRHVELKKSTGELKDGMHSLCAMLNSDGGYVIFGIAPQSLKIIGQMVTDNTRQEIGREIRKLEPSANYCRHHQAETRLLSLQQENRPCALPYHFP